MPDTSPQLDGLRILVVDDNHDARELLTAALHRCGAEVTAVASTAEALGALGRVSPDVLVSDIGMQGEDGYDLLRKVRELPPERGRQIPALAVTAYAGIEDRNRALAAGYQTHIPKPIDPARLAIAVAQLAGGGGRP